MMDLRGEGEKKKRFHSKPLEKTPNKGTALGAHEQIDADDKHSVASGDSGISGWTWGSSEPINLRSRSVNETGINRGGGRGRGQNTRFVIPGGGTVAQGTHEPPGCMGHP